MWAGQAPGATRFNMLLENGLWRGTGGLEPSGQKVMGKPEFADGFSGGGGEAGVLEAYSKGFSE